MTTRAGGVLDL